MEGLQERPRAFRPISVFNFRIKISQLLKVPLAICSRHYLDYSNYSWKSAINSIHDPPAQQKALLLGRDSCQQWKTTKNSQTSGRRPLPGSQPSSASTLGRQANIYWHCDGQSCKRTIRKSSFMVQGHFVDLHRTLTVVSVVQRRTDNSDLLRVS